jgi:serine/threonine protein kinase
MSLSIADFWKLVVDSRLLAPDQCRKLEEDFAHVKGAGSQSNAKALAEWLVARQAVSRYQATVLLAGRPGAFYYGDYRVYDRIDKGALKGQFCAIHAPTGHPVMLRFLAGSVLKDNREWALIAARVVKQAGVVNPLLQRYYEPIDLQAFRFVATEDLRGDTLEELLAKHGRLPPPEAARVIRMTAFALSYLHQLGMAHGDIRPSQILYEANGNVKLLIDPAQIPAPLNVAQLDPTSPAAAKADYLAPEFLQVNKKPDVATDIYALGCTFYQLLTGQVPFAGGLPGQKLARHAAEPIQPLDPYGVPHPLGQLVAFMMAKNPAVRIAHAAQVAEQLGPYVDPAKLQLPTQSPPPTLATYESWIKQKQAVLTNVEKVKASAPQGPVINAAAAPAKSTGEGGVAVAAPTSTVAARTTGRSSKKQQMPLLIGGGVAAAVVVVLLLIVANSGSGTKPIEDKPIAKKGDETVPTTNVDNTKKKKGTPPEVPVGPSTGIKDPGPKVVETPVAKYDVQPDDGKALWASPTTGAPVELSNVPPNAQIFLIARPAEMLASADGQKVLDALGPQFTTHRATWEKNAGVKLTDVAHVVMALHDNGGKMPRPSYRVQLTAPVPEAELVTRWGNPAPKDTDGARYYEAAGRAFYVPPAGNGNVFVMGDPLDVKEVAVSKGAPPALRREVDQLRRLTDNDRHFTLLFAPNYLFSDGRELFSGPYQKTLEPIAWFLGDDVKATMTSLHFGENFYAELRLIGELTRDKNMLAGDLRKRLEEVPDNIENYIVALNPPTYWKKVALRYPSMIRLLSRNTRVGVEDDVATVNAIGPGPLAHNLFFGGELALMSTPGASVASTGGPTEAPKPKNVEDLLKHKITFEVVRNDMNLVMSELEKEIRTDLPGLPFEFAIKIIGKDLELDGITRNQAISMFKMENTPLEGVLNGLVIKANGVAPDPSDAAQKLVWVVGPDPDKPDHQVILITTRKACETKKYNLRPPFVKK